MHRPKAAKGGRKDAIHGGRSRHDVRDAKMRGGSWRVAGVGEVQVDNVTFQERRWGLGAIYIERLYDNEFYCWGGGIRVE